jgi:hypothetical protein
MTMNDLVEPSKDIASLFNFAISSAVNTTTSSGHDGQVHERFASRATTFPGVLRSRSRVFVLLFSYHSDSQIRRYL